MKEPKDIYDLELHEGMAINQTISVFRVPGGWIYKYTYGSLITTIFIPYNNEFQTGVLK